MIRLRDLSERARKYQKENKFLLQTQMITTFILVVSMMGTGIFYYANARALLIQNGEKYAKLIFKQINVSIDIIIDSVVDVSKQLYRDQVLAAILRKDGPASYDDVSTLEKTIEQVRAANRNISSVSLYMHKDRKMFSSEYGILEPDDFFLQWFATSKSSLALMNTHIAEIDSYTGQNENYLSVCTKLPLEQPKAANGGLLINIKQSTIYEQVIASAHIDDEAQFFVLDENGSIIVAKDERDLYKRVEDLPGLGLSLAGNAGYFTRTVDGEVSLIVHEMIEKRNWRYVMVFPFKDLNRMIIGIRFVIFGLSFVLIGIGVMLLIMVVRRTVHPLDELISMVRKKITIDHPLRDRELLKSIGALYSAQENTDRILQTAAPLYRERYLQNLILHKHNDRTVLEGQAISLSLDIPFDYLILVAAEFSDGMNRHKWILGDYLIKDAIVNAINKSMQERNLRGFCAETDTSKVAVVVSVSPQDQANLRELVSWLHASIEKQIGMSPFFGVCDRSTDIANLHSSYLAAEEALQARVLFNDAMVIFHCDLGKEVEEHYRYPYEEEERLKSYVLVMDREKTYQSIEKIVGSAKNPKSFFILMRTAYQLNSAMIMLIDSMGLPAEEIYSKVGDMKPYELISSIHETEKFFQRLADTVIRFMEDRRESRQLQYAEMIMFYIEENHSKQLSVDDICRGVNLSAAYVHQILKAATGRTVVQYLNDFRIQKACSLLEKTDLKVYEIAERIGFSSTKYFITVFKEIKGVTPGDYKGRSG